MLYISGEESSGQLALRAHRIGAVREGTDFICQQDFLSILRMQKSMLIVLDSVQAFRVFPMKAGGWVLPTRCAMSHHGQRKCQKNSQIPLVLVGHITANKDRLPPKLLEHMVDVVPPFFR